MTFRMDKQWGPAVEHRELYAITHDGAWRRIMWEDCVIYVWLGHFALQQKLTQYCKSAIIFKIKKLKKKKKKPVLSTSGYWLFMSFCWQQECGHVTQAWPSIVLHLHCPENKQLTQSFSFLAQNLKVTYQCAIVNSKERGPESETGDEGHVHKSARDSCRQLQALEVSSSSWILWASPVYQPVIRANKSFPT